MRYPVAAATGVEPRTFIVGQRVKVDTDRRWWTVTAVTEHFAALTRGVPFRPAGTLCYTVVDWRHGVRGPCNLIGQGYGDGTYTPEQCAEMLDRFESGDLEVSQRNWVPIHITAEES